MMMTTVMRVHLAITITMTTGGDDGNEVPDRGEDYGDWCITSGDSLLLELNSYLSSILIRILTLGMILS